VKSVNYVVTVDERMFGARCEDGDNKGTTDIDDLVDVSQLKVLYDDDFETVHASGNVIIKRDLPKEPIKMEIKVYKWNRRGWEETALLLKRNNFCKSLRDPFEAWYSYIMIHIPREQRICPPEQGHTYTLYNLTNRVFVRNVPRFDIEGDLKIVMNFAAGDLKTCLLLFATI
ncbi:hypothetical protein KR222_010557, partial [Zaprionus bogoriensis]